MVYAADVQEGQKYGYDTEAFAIYDTIKYVNFQSTRAVGTAWGEADMLHRGKGEQRTSSW